MKKLFVALLSLLLLACAPKPQTVAPGVRDAAERLPQKKDGVLFVSVLPQKYFLDRISGGRWQVEVMVPPGASPETYSPTPGQISRLARAAAYFRVGVPFEEAFLPSVQAQWPQLPVIDTREGITLRRMEGPAMAAGDEHEVKEGEEHHHHEGLDPHIWLSPRLAAEQARAMTEWLAAHDPDQADAYRRNYNAFVKDTDQLHHDIAATLANLSERTLLVFHPAWGYFCDEFDLRQAAIEMEGKTPAAEPLTRVIDFARAQGIRVVFVQRQFSIAEAESVAEAIGGAVVPLDPLAPDWMENLRSIAGTLADKLGKP